MKTVIQFTRVVAFAIAAAMVPAMASAQGGRGGFGGVGGARGRGERGQGDTTAAGAPRPQLNFADIVFAHRSEIQLTDSQMVRLSDIRMASMSKRALLTHEADSVKAAMAVSPDERPAPATDSSRKALLEQRRALGAVLGDLHDVDVNARKETLAMLNPLQQKKAELLQEIADSPPTTKAEGGREGRSGRAAAGRPHGGAGEP